MTQIHYQSCLYNIIQLTVQPLCRGQRYEELTAIGIRATAHNTIHQQYNNYSKKLKEKEKEKEKIKNKLIIIIEGPLL